MDRWNHKFELKKDRWVYVPTKEMKDFGRRLHNHLRKKWTPPLYFYHLRKGGHIAAVKKHISHHYFASLDISGFFETTSQSRVTRELKSFFAYSDARALAKLSTVRNPSPNGAKFIVPYGYTQSPILATLCLCKSRAGAAFNKINKSGLVSISVYVDDIVLSSDDLSQLFLDFHSVINSLERSGYSVNKSKLQHPSNSVTVFNLNLTHGNIKVSPWRLYDFLTDFIKSTNPYEKEGIASYIKSVNAEQARLFKG